MATMRVPFEAGRQKVDGIMGKAGMLHTLSAVLPQRGEKTVRTIGKLALILAFMAGIAFGSMSLWPSDAAIHLEEAQPQPMTNHQAQADPRETVDVSVSLGPVSVGGKMTPEQLREEMDGAKQAIRNTGYMLASMAAQSTPEYREARAYYSSLGKRGFNDDEQFFLSRGYPLHDSTALKLREQAVLLLRDAPRGARQVMKEWTVIPQNRGKDATPLLQDICDQFDGPAIDKLRILVAECVKMGQPI